MGKGDRRKTKTRPTPHALTAQERHVRALQRELTETRHMTSVGLRRIIASVPELRGLVLALGELVMCADPLASKEIAPVSVSGSRDPSGIGVRGNRATFRSAMASAEARDRLGDVNAMCEKMARRVLEMMGGDGDAVPADPPRCGNPDCVLFGVPQGYGVETCRDCGDPLKEA